MVNKIYVQGFKCFKGLKGTRDQIVQGFKWFKVLYDSRIQNF